MNYFEIINATLTELNYAPVAAFSDLTKLEHKRLMNIINRLNKEICAMNDEFFFRQQVKKLQLYPNKVEYNVDLDGKITRIAGQNEEYNFEPNYTLFYDNKHAENTYSIYGKKLLFSPSDKAVKIFYSTNNFVISDKDVLKSDFENETDKSIIPDNFVEKLFINGAAYNFKQNTAHPKYIHWKQEYDKAVRELLSEGKKVSGSGVVIDGGFRKL